MRGKVSVWEPRSGDVVDNPCRPQRSKGARGCTPHSSKCRSRGAAMSSGPPFCLCLHPVSSPAYIKVAGMMEPVHHPCRERKFYLLFSLFYDSLESLAALLDDVEACGEVLGVHFNTLEVEVACGSVCIFGEDFIHACALTCLCSNLHVVDDCSVISCEDNGSCAGVISGLVGLLGRVACEV